jgi:hypothetical protein
MAVCTAAPVAMRMRAAMHAARLGPAAHYCVQGVVRRGKLASLEVECDKVWPVVARRVPVG